MVAQKAIAIVPTKERKILVYDPQRERTRVEKPVQAFALLQRQQVQATVAVMLGPGQEFFARLVDLEIPVHRIPMYRLQKLTGVEAGASAEERATALVLAWEEAPQSFYQMAQLDQSVVLVRELCRQRLSIQEFRTKATLKLHTALRTLEYILPEEAAQLVELLRKGLKDLSRKPQLRRQIEEEFSRLNTAVRLSSMQQARILAIRQTFSNPGFVLGAKKDEQELEKQISRFLNSFPIWSWIKEGPVEIKGFGPAVGGAIISELGDIMRFPTPEALRSYARFHVNGEGKFPHRRAGEISSWNSNLNRAVWLWSTDQMPRYKHPWRELYDWKKALEMQAHPDAIAKQVRVKGGRTRTVYDYTLKHLDSRSKRWTGSQMLSYLWELWQQVAAGNNPEEWYPSSRWPAYFAQAAQALANGLRVYLETEIPKRRRAEPAEPEEEDEESS